MIKCINCPYYIANNNGYPFCCLYCMDLDRVAIFNLCRFMEKDDSNKNKND